MTQNPRFDELLGLISRLCAPVGIDRSLNSTHEEIVAEIVRDEIDALNSLREEDIPLIFDMIGHEPARVFGLDSETLDGQVTWLLSHLADKYPTLFLATLEQRIGSIPSVVPLIDGAEDVDGAIGRMICELVSSRRCLSRTERTLLRERCATTGCRYPFSDVAIDPAWHTTDVMLLAQGIYDEKAFDRMPILADALQDAGCDNTDILDHCRDTNQVHVRGCWVVDLVLGKE